MSARTATASVAPLARRGDHVRVACGAVSCVLVLSGCLVDRSAIAPSEDVDGSSERDGGTRPRDGGALDANLDARPPSELDAPTLDAVVSPDASAPPDAYVPPDAYRPDDLVAWYPFVDGEPLLDATGNGHALTNAGVSFCGSVGSFGSGDQLTTPDAEDLDEIRALSAWVRPSMRRSHRMGVVDRDGVWGIFVRPDGEAACAMYGTTWILSPAQLPLDEWTHVACTVDAGTVHLFVDGREVASIEGAAPADAATRIQIGQNCCDGADELRGDLSDVRFYRRPLSERDAARLAAMAP